MKKLDIEDPSGRLLFLLQKIWGGSQTRMARDTGLSPSAISNVATGRQGPGRHILSAVAAHPLVNAAWLLTGEGDPLAQVTPTGVAHRQALYVAERLFEGMAEDHSDCLGAMHEVFATHYRPSRYWVRVDENNPLAEDPKLKIAVNDFVLFEPDPAGWPEDVSGRPCIAIQGRGKNRKLLIGRIVRSIPDGKAEVDLYRLDDSAATSNATRERSVHPDTGPMPPAKSAYKRVRLVAVGVFRCGDCGS